MYIVNGVINKVDGNYFNEFHVSEIGDTGIILGPYPEN
jgi:hypothetical protein